MTTLDTKLPPPIGTALTAAAMWTLVKAAPAANLLPVSLHLPATARFSLAAAIAAVGLFFLAAGVQRFGQAGTTINPVNPNAATALVTTGIFARTRNPMYVGFCTLLLAWATALAAPLALLGPIAFALFLTRFQIMPEERVLREKFGAAYEAYLARTPRWL